jgi:hypothetical protein
VFLSSQLTIPPFPLDVVDDVPGVNTGRDEFRASFGQLGEHFFTALVDKGHACKIYKALTFPAGVFCSRPAGLQFRNPWLNESAFKRPPLLGECFGYRDS